MSVNNRAALAWAAVLLVSLVDPRYRSPRTAKSYHQHFEFFLLKSSTTLLHECSHGRYAGVPLDEIKKLLDIIPHRGSQLDPFGAKSSGAPALQRSNSCSEHFGSLFRGDKFFHNGCPCCSAGNLGVRWLPELLRALTISPRVRGIAGYCGVLRH